MTLTAPHATRVEAPRASSLGLITGFAVYLVLVVWIVLWKLEIPWIGGVDRVIKLVPFVASAGQGASKPSEVVINLLLFVPFGLYLGLLAPSWRWWRVAGVIAATSLALEVTQFVLAIGSTDVTDLVANTAGGVAGFALAAVTRRLSRAGGRGILIRICVIGTIAALLAVTLFVVSPIRFRPPHDGGLGTAPGHAVGSENTADQTESV